MKPKKKTDAALFKTISDCILIKGYAFTYHAVRRLKERNISPVVAISILLNKKGFLAKRNKKKDKYERDYEDWSYCFEGQDQYANRMRVIISFDSLSLIIITVMYLEE